MAKVNRNSGWCDFDYRVLRGPGSGSTLDLDRPVPLSGDRQDKIGTVFGTLCRLQFLTKYYNVPVLT
eukprot:4719-Rhodomonas_salina.2